MSPRQKAWRRNLLWFVLTLGVTVVVLVPFFEDAASEFLHREKAVKLLFTGDGMFDRTVRTTGERQGYEYILEPLSDTFARHDAVIMNVEGPITTYPSVSADAPVGDPNNTRFTFSSAIVPVLSKLNVIAHVGNNHIWDFGREGIEQSKNFLEEADVPYFGDSNGASSNTLIREIEGSTIGFVSYNEFAGGSRTRALEALRMLSPSVDFTVLYAHWGEEYTNVPTPNQTVLAREFVDAGADLVLGSHSHTVQAREVIEGVPVYYSLGNLVFDQYWEKSVRCGALLSIVIKNGVVESHELIPVSLEKNRQTTLEKCE